MKKIIRLTERDLTRIVKRVIKENEMDYSAEDAITELQDYVNINSHLSMNRLLRDISRASDEAEKILSDEEYKKFMDYVSELEDTIHQEYKEYDEDDDEYYLY